MAQFSSLLDEQVQDAIDRSTYPYLTKSDARKAAERLNPTDHAAGLDEYIALFESIAVGVDRSELLTNVSSDLREAVQILKPAISNYFDPNGSASYYAEKTLLHLIYQPDGSRKDRAKSIALLWELFSGSSLLQFTPQLLMMQNYHEYYGLLREVADFIKPLSYGIGLNVVASVSSSEDPTVVFERIKFAHSALERFGSSWDAFYSSANCYQLFDLCSSKAPVRDSEISKIIHLAILKEHLTIGLQSFFGEQYEIKVQTLNGNTTVNVTIDTNDPRLQDLTDAVKGLGINEENVTDLVSSWLSYSSIGIAFRDISPTDDVSSINLQVVTNNQVQRILRQFESLVGYVYDYGVDETVKLMDLFGIRNFVRYEDSAVLHTQVKAWTEGRVPIEGVVLLARADWNGVIGRDSHLINGKNNLVFEVGSNTDIARSLVKIGNRERSNGRSPRVSVVTITGHASPYGIDLGEGLPKTSNGSQVITEEDFDRGYINRSSRPQDFVRHLGEVYEVVLGGCSTAAPVDDRNIAQGIQEHHGRVTYGFPVPVKGKLQINDLIVGKPPSFSSWNSPDPIQAVKYNSAIGKHR